MTSTRAMLGIDVGGTGSRIALNDSGGGPARVLAGPRVSIGASGSSVPEVVSGAIDRARREWPEAMQGVVAAGVGATGLASLVADPAALAARLRDELACPVALSIDAVTAHLGALSGRGGAVVALGTGAIALSHPGPDERGLYAPVWRRADGWGHLLGDRGGGAWLGRAALECALRAYDAVDPAGGALLAAGERRYGDPPGWPGLFYTREDRAGRLADFAADVVSLAEGGDAAASALVDDAGRQAARTGLAVLGTSCPRRLALTGGLGRVAPLRAGFAAEITAAQDPAEIAEPAGDPLEGALLLAGLAADGRLSAQSGFLWT